MQTLSRAIRASAHRRMAYAALRSDSSLAVRLERYSRHIAEARRLQPQGVPRRERASNALLIDRLHAKVSKGDS